MRISMDAIRSRVSTRSYDGSLPTPEEAGILRDAFVEAVPGPFGASPRFILASRDEVEEAEAGEGRPRGRVRVGTYGMIMGPRAFIAGVVEKRPFACVDFGYGLEGIVLKATELGLKTCWIGGIFSRGAIAKALGAGKDEIVPATTPVGRAAPRPSLQDRIVTGGAQARTRKAPGELFFAAAEDGRLEGLPELGRWKDAFEAVRLGPSASNKQPWRLVLDRRGGEAVHLVLCEDKRYNNMLGDVKLQELDMGIAMRHLEVAAAELGLPGSWRRLEAEPLVLEQPMRYIATFV
jgi:Nitroreductase family.